MKTKQELKQFFENGDKLTQEQFWEWQDSYWHKDETIPQNKVEIDLSQKADLVDGKVPSSQLPSYVDDVLEFATFSELPNPGEKGKIYTTPDNNKIYRWAESKYIEINNKALVLRDIVTKGNYSPNPISFIYENTPNDEQGSANGQIGANPETYSFFFGNMNANHTGAYNHSYGYGSLEKVSSGSYNSAYGAYSGNNLTTGNYNILIGQNTRKQLTTSTGNVFIGTNSGSKATTSGYNTFIGVEVAYDFDGNAHPQQDGVIRESTDNTFIGRAAGYYTKRGRKNTFVGSDCGARFGNYGSYNTFLGSGIASYTSHTWGENNVVIGSHAAINGELNDSFIVDSRREQTPNPALVTPLIKGNFKTPSLNIGGVFSITPSFIPDGKDDNLFTKNIVAKADGTLGWEDRAHGVSQTEYDKNSFDFQSTGNVNNLHLNIVKTGKVVNVNYRLNVDESTDGQLSRLFTMPLELRPNATKYPEINFVGYTYKGVKPFKISSNGEVTVDFAKGVTMLSTQGSIEFSVSYTL
ncbi:MAG: hypothetical protein KBA33_02960 [Cloacibacterium sp.]|nr:hypothetical protein [Cloacibacterium sp.]